MGLSHRELPISPATNGPTSPDDEAVIVLLLQY